MSGYNNRTIVRFSLVTVGFQIIGNNTCNFIPAITADNDITDRKDYMISYDMALLKS